MKISEDEIMGFLKLRWPAFLTSQDIQPELSATAGGTIARCRPEVELKKQARAMDLL